MSLHEDIVRAQRIVSGTEYNFGEKTFFHNTSAIYKISNERTQEYYHYLINQEKVLSVIASGDQILNLMLEGTKVIDAFDISSFPKYFLFLKMAAIKALSKEEYIDFFYDITQRAEIYDDMYDRISFYLNDEVSEFWDSLFNFFDWQDIYNSTLFSSEPYMVATAINQNKFLQCDAAYEELKSKLDEVKINTYECDIYQSINLFRDSYDLVYLSNIFFYNNLSLYKDLLGNVRLTENGIVLTYLHTLHSKVKEYFEGLNVCYDQFNNSDAGVMIYRK